MSRETLHGLNTNTLIGNTDARGHAWHYRAEEQGEPNHYPGPVPIGDVRRRLFCWSAVSRPLAVEAPASVEELDHLAADGTPARWLAVEDRQAICRSDTDHVMGIFAPGYQMHQYDEWLLTTVANILDDHLSISSAGLLKGGAVAWVVGLSSAMRVSRVRRDRTTAGLSRLVPALVAVPRCCDLET